MPKDTTDTATRMNPLVDHPTGALIDQMCQAQLAALSPITGYSASAIEGYADVIEAWSGFVARRMRENNRTLHGMLHCHNPVQMHQLQSAAFQQMLDDWQDHAGRLCALANTAARAEAA